MNDILSHLAQLRRPRLLMRAARIGAENFKRDIHLPRLLGAATPARHGPALLQLIEIESTMNEQRLCDESGYHLLQHVEVMIAIVAEAQALRISIDAAT